MRLKEGEITDRNIIDDIINTAQVCRLAMCKDNIPYLVPLAFGYDGKCIFLHSAKEGQKIDFINSNNRVCVEFERNIKIQSNEESACKWAFDYETAICSGRIYEIKQPEEAIKALKLVLKHYSEKEWNIPQNLLKVTAVWKIEIDEITGKKST